jgi:signal transduction histidine kinase
LGGSALIDDGAFVKLLWEGARVNEFPKIFENERLQYALLFFITVNAPVLLIFSNASALVHRHQLAPAKSIFFSAVTVVKNYRALAVFAIAWLAVSIAISFAISLLTLMAANSKELFVTLVFSSSLLWYAMILTSMYFTFRDCFEATLGEPQ